VKSSTRSDPTRPPIPAAPVKLGVSAQGQARLCVVSGSEGLLGEPERPGRPAMGSVGGQGHRRRRGGLEQAGPRLLRGRGLPTLPVPPGPEDPGLSRWRTGFPKGPTASATSREGSLTRPGTPWPRPWTPSRKNGPGAPGLPGREPGRPCNVDKLISNRMKKRGMAWRLDGARNMLAVITLPCGLTADSGLPARRSRTYRSVSRRRQDRPEGRAGKSARACGRCTCPVLTPAGRWRGSSGRSRRSTRRSSRAGPKADSLRSVADRWSTSSVTRGRTAPLLSMRTERTN